MVGDIASHYHISFFFKLHIVDRDLVRKIRIIINVLVSEQSPRSNCSSDAVNHFSHIFNINQQQATGRAIFIALQFKI